MPRDLDLPAGGWPCLTDLLDQALDLPPGRREEWLKALEPEASDVKAALERLLAAHDRAAESRFLEALPTDGLIDPSQTADDSAAAAPGPGDDAASGAGTQVGPYRLERELGRGGMGTVWLAHRTDGALHRVVALKLPRPGFGGRSFLDRFARERDILAGLEHPHIARLYDAGLTPDGQPYLALEYVDGEPLKTYCDRRRLDLRGRIRLFLQVLDAVQYAHRALVVHRDLKPGNIMVSALGEALLLDFGIARLLEEEGGGARPTDLTEQGFGALTPDYASPEQIAGRPVTTASDVYSLGVILYELVCGRRPYRLARGSRAELEEEILATEPLAPSRAGAGAEESAARGTTPRRLSGELAGDLDTIVLKALKKDPAARYASAEALARDLHHFLKGEPVEARPDSRLYRVSKFVSRHAAAVGVAAAVLAVILASLAFALAQMRLARKERDVALFEARRAEAGEELASFLLGEGSATADQRGIEERLEQSRRMIGRQFAADPLIRAGLLFQLAERYSELRDLARQGGVLEEIDAIARDTGLAWLRARQRCALAEMKINQGESEAAETLVAEGFAQLARESDPPPLAESECLITDSYLAASTGRFDRAVERGRAALHLMEENGLTRTQRYADCWDALMTAYNFSGDARRALDAVRRERDTYAALGRTGTLAHVKTLYLEATFLNRGGRRQEALDRSDEVLAQSRARGFPENHAQNMYRGIILAGMGRPADALPLFDAAAEAFAAEEMDHDLLQAEIWAADALLQTGRTGDARRRLDRRWLAIEEQIKARSAAMTKGLRVRAAILQAEGRRDEAWETIHRALTIIEESGSPTYSGAPAILLLAAQIALARQDTARALDLATRALEQVSRNALDPEQSADVGEALLARARVLTAMGRLHEAREDLSRAHRHLQGTIPPDHPLALAAASGR